MQKSEQQYIDLYRQSARMIESHAGAMFNARRAEACADFERLGFPTRKDERHKYTDMGALFAPDYGLNLNRLEIPVNPFDAFRCDVPNLSTSLYFMVNDAFHTKATPRAALPEGVVIDSLGHADARGVGPQVAALYGRLARTDQDGVCALNTMLAQDGLLVYVPKGVRVERPVQVVNILRADVDLMVNRRVLIVLEEGASIKLLFCDHAADDRRFLTTQVIEAYVGRGASLDLYCLEETHAKNTRVSDLHIRQEAGSHVCHNAITLTGGVTRNRVDLTFEGEGARCQMGGLVIADGNQHVDNNVLIDHKAGGCDSNVLYKYVLDGQATGAFAGRVLVRPDAQHTTSVERNQNICATREARMYSQPMLEIYADDVQCSHGSTVGQLDEAALFYMQQRGIAPEEARMLMKFAFAGEVIDRIELEPLQDRLHHLVEKRFRGDLGRCEGCRLCK